VSRLCRLDEVPDGGARGFPLDAADDASPKVIVVRRGRAAWVYRNRCPHRGTPLDWVPDRFLDVGGEHLICATHGAVFRIEDGLCLAGPCAGDALVAVAATVADGEVVLAEPAPER